MSSGRCYATALPDLRPRGTLRHRAEPPHAVDRVHAEGDTSDSYPRAALRGPSPPRGRPRPFWRAGHSRATDREQPVRRARGAASIPAGCTKGTGLGEGRPILGCLQHRAAARDRCCVLRNCRHSTPIVGRRGRRQRLGVLHFPCPDLIALCCMPAEPYALVCNALRCSCNNSIDIIS
jgi:hypothetical protein